jgi:hypothetical protein
MLHMAQSKMTWGFQHIHHVVGEGSENPGVGSSILP